MTTMTAMIDACSDDEPLASIWQTSYPSRLRIEIVGLGGRLFWRIAFGRRIVHIGWGASAWRDLAETILRVVPVVPSGEAH